MTTEIRGVSPLRSPFSDVKIGSVGFTVGAESVDVINVAIQLKSRSYADLAVRGRVRAYLSADANGDTPVANGPNGGVAIGTDGLLLPGPYAPSVCLAKGTLAIHSTPEQFKTTTTAYYRINGVQYSKAAATALTFTAAHTVTASKFGVILVQVNAAGTVSTKVPSSTQAYNTAALALAALPAPDAGKAAIGYIAIANNTVDWVANTDDLTAASDLTTATFVDLEEPSPSQFDLVSESDGDIDVNITETGVKTMYLAVVLPDGTLTVSSAITFA